MSRVHKKTLVVDGITPVFAYATLRTRSESGSFLLESVIPGERWGRYSVLGYHPKSQVVLHSRPGVNPFAELRRLIATDGTVSTDVAERLADAHFGVVSYDVVHTATR